MVHAIGNSIFKIKDLKLEIKNIVGKYWIQACAIGTYGYFYELMKYEIQSVAIKKCKLLRNVKREKEIKIIKAISDLQMKNCGNLETSEEVLNMYLLQSQLKFWGVRKEKS